MSADTLRLVLQIIGVVVGGGILEFLRRMVNRRVELRKLAAETGATTLDAQNAYVKTLQDAEAALRAELRRQADQFTAERVVLKDALEAATREVDRAHAALARTKADLVVAQSQIAELGGRLPGRHRDPLDPGYDWRRGGP